MQRDPFRIPRRPLPRLLPRLLSLGLLLDLLSACGTPHYAGSHWDGRRGYDGAGDYGYDLNAARAEARSYRQRATRDYPHPGPPEDPWGPYVTEAASHFSIPERWIREVMRQESGGHLYGSGGRLTTSWVGAMGLMQVMPQTYDMLRRRYALGPDAYEPHDNIMAGAAYIREMSDRYGAPGFLAAYNAGPDRLDAYLAGTQELPAETVNYLARIAPRLGNDVAMTGPLAIYANGGGGGMGVYGGRYALAARGGYGGGGDPADRAYAGGGMAGATYYSPRRARAARAYARAAPPVVPPVETASAEPLPLPPPQPLYAPVAAAAPRRPSLFASAQAAEPRPALASGFVPVAAPGSAPSGWSVQVGALPDPAQSRRLAQSARLMAPGLLGGAQALTPPVARNGGTLYRARLAGLSPDSATAACGLLARRGMACFTVPPGS